MSHFFNNRILSRNISCLKEKFPEILRFIDKTGHRTVHHVTAFRGNNGFINLVIQNTNGLKIPIYINDEMVSKSSNIYSYSRLEDYDLVFILGLGLGYDCLEIIRGVIKKPRVVILEPSLKIFNSAIRIINLTEIFSYKRLDLHVGTSISIETIIEAYKHLIPVGKVRIDTIPSYRLIFGNQIINLEEKLKNHIITIRDIWYTSKKNGKQILGNTFNNFPSLLAGTPMNKLKDRFEGIIAVCVAAGPSLDMGINFIRKIKNKALIIACDSSVNALLSSGIIPHIVVTTDIFKINFEKIKNHVDSLRDSILIYGIESNPDNVRKYLSRKRVAVSSNSKILLDWLDPKWNLNCRLPSLTSVSQLAIFSALALGADPIIMVGMDLSYHNGRSHSTGSVIQENLNMKKIVKVRGANGTKIFSSQQFITDKIHLEGEIGECETRFINTSMDGALIQGTEIKSLDEIFSTDIKCDVDINRLQSEIDWTQSISGTEAIAELNGMLQQVIEFKDVCDVNEKLINDSIETFSAKGKCEQIAKRSKVIKRDFENFQHKNGLILGIIELAIGEEIHEILKKRESIAAKDYKDQGRKNWDETDLIRDHYRAYGKGADFFYDRLNKTKTELEEAYSLKQTGSDNNIRDQWNKHLKLGRHYAKSEEIWQAEREYLMATQIRPEDPTPWFELAQMLADSGLWRPARDNVEKACRLFPNNLALINLKADIQDKIKGIIDQIKNAWVGGDKETTRRLLNGYLLLSPDDEQANLLKDVLKELDETLAADSAVMQQQKSSDLQFDELLANAVQCIEKLEFELAIGIIEGLIENFPPKAAVLREKIGDIRMLQQDYLSAVWNYDQALRFTDGEFEIKAKLNKAKQELGYVNKGCTHRENHLQKTSYF